MIYFAKIFFFKLNFYERLKNINISQYFRMSLWINLYIGVPSRENQIFTVLDLVTILNDNSNWNQPVLV